jgi:hypothetical protein
MNSSLRPALALLLGTTAALLTSCDYAKYSPGKTPQYAHNFNNPPGFRSYDVYRDSVNYQQNVHQPIGKGSAPDIKNGTVDDQLQSAPGGKSSASPQAASGGLNSTDQANPTDANKPPKQ